MGRRFCDHPQVVLEWTPTDYLDRGSDSWISACLNFRSADGPASGDLQILPSNVPLSVLTRHPPVTPEPTLPLLISALTPTPSGSLRLVSTDPRAALEISYGYLSTATDREHLRQAVRTALALVSTRAFGPVRGGSTDLDDRTAADDRSLDRWIRERLGTSLHASGSAPMGSADDPATVVDQFGRVHGIGGLRNRRHLDPARGTVARARRDVRADRRGDRALAAAVAVASAGRAVSRCSRWTR